jgi:hypothetical protein
MVSWGSVSVGDVNAGSAFVQLRVGILGSDLSDSVTLIAILWCFELVSAKEYRTQRASRSAVKSPATALTQCHV